MRWAARSVGYFRFNGRALADSFEGLSDRPRFEDAQKIVAGDRARARRRSIGEIYLVSTRFLSMGSQKVETRRLVPLDLPATRKGSTVFEFEPDPAQRSWTACCHGGSKPRCTSPFSNRRLLSMWPNKEP